MNNKAGEIPLFCLLAFMEAVKNGLHVHLGVSAKLNAPFGDFASRPAS